MVENPAPVRSALEEFRAHSYFGGLDLLRGLSILLVIFHHVPTATGPWVEGFQSNARYGVALFFVISGFLIATLLLRELRTAGSISLGNFYARRSLRILPLYFACLALHVALVYGLHAFNPENREIFTQKLPSYLLFYSNWLPTATAGPFFQAWSLAAEEQFYLSFAFLLVFFRKSWLVPLAIAALALKFFIYSTWGAVDTWSAAWRIGFSYQESIIWGVLLAFALEQPRVFAVLHRLARSPLFLPGAALATLAWLLFHPIRHAATWDGELLYVLMTGLVLGTVLHPSRNASAAAPLAFVGRISYGIYLLHMVVISFVKKLPGADSPLPCFLIATAAVIPTAAVVYQFFEKPIIGFYKRRFSHRPGARPQKPAPAGTLKAAPAVAP
jgi:peptidoglycan/LPS O-acetylase OafA/YrhL